MPPPVCLVSPFLRAKLMFEKDTPRFAVSRYSEPAFPLIFLSKIFMDCCHNGSLYVRTVVD